MLNPKNIFATRKGKAAECFDFCRGLKLKNKNGNTSFYESFLTMIFFAKNNAVIQFAFQCENSFEKMYFIVGVI